MWCNILGLTYLIVTKYSFYERKLLESWHVLRKHNPIGNYLRSSILYL
jgi:hypothetical protein